MMDTGTEKVATVGNSYNLLFHAALYYTDHSSGIKSVKYTASPVKPVPPGKP